MSHLPKIHTISKKIVIALLGTFLLVFLLFHAGANLCILRNDGGQWYTDFCHFMGSNYIVKIFEVVLLGCLALHIVLTLVLNIGNYLARPQRYHHSQCSATAPSSKTMVLTGLLMLACIGLHFTDFFLVKFGLRNTAAQYMMDIETFSPSEEILVLANAAEQMEMTPEEVIASFKNDVDSLMANGELSAEDIVDAEEQIAAWERSMPVIEILKHATENISDDNKWLRHITWDEKVALKAAGDDVKIEPDFYNMARDLFGKTHISLLYLLFFAIVGLHIRHAFESAFQTLGLNNHTYANAITTAAVIYTWIIILAFAAVPIGVMLGLAH